MREPRNWSEIVTRVLTSSQFNSEPSMPRRREVQPVSPTLLALCSSLLEKSIKGGMIVVGGVNLGGSVDPVYNAVSVAELAVEKGATLLLMPVSARKQLFDLSDDMATKVDIQFYSDTREALIKALAE
jgi:ATP-dependent Lon protease